MPKKAASTPNCYHDSGSQSSNHPPTPRRPPKKKKLDTQPLKSKFHSNEYKERWKKDLPVLDGKSRAMAAAICSAVAAAAIGSAEGEGGGGRRGDRWEDY